jgi:acyl-CoA dehydrogenase
MSDDDLGAVLAEQVQRLLAERTDVATLRAVERGEWPEAAWVALEELGLPLALVPEAMGGSGLGWAAAGAVFETFGRHAAPVPMGETMVAAALLAGAGIAPPPGPIAPAADGAVQVPWGRHARHLTLVEGDRVALIDAAALRWEHGANIGREPRDSTTPGAPAAEGRLPAAFGSEAGLHALALLRACQIAGALSATLALAVEYANTRKQFGRPIGRFHAIQQNLAAFAGEAAAAQVAAANACRAADRHGFSGAGFEIACAKVVAGEAAGTGAASAHQVFAAIGFTEEHSLHHLTRRLWSWRAEAGTERFWAARIGREAQARGGEALWLFITGRDEDDAA